MAKNDSDFMLVLRSIIGDRIIPEALMAAIRKQWDANPNALIAQANATKQKMNNRIISNRLRETPAMTAPKSSLVRSAEMPSKIDYKGPSQRDIIELRLNSGDMSMFSDFGRAFNEARKRGQSEFTWRETGANPSGRFNTQLRPNLPVNNADHSSETGNDEGSLNNTATRKLHPMEKPLKVSKTLAQLVKAAMPATSMKGSSSTFATFGSPALMSDGSFRNTSRVMLMGSDDKFKELGKQRWMFSNKDQYGNAVENPRWEPMDVKVNVRYQQQGGTMGVNEQELQQAFMAFLIEDAAAQGMQIQSEQDLQAYAQQLGEEGLKAKYQEFMLKMQGGVKAALGAKLNYIHKLKGNCPEGEELVYMKQGGRVCPVCQKKAEKAKDGKKLPKKNAVADFKEKRKQINPNDTVNTKFGPRDLNGKTKYPKYNAKKENYDFETRKRVQEKDEKSGKKVIGSACGSKMKKK